MFRCTLSATQTSRKTGTKVNLYLKIRINTHDKTIPALHTIRPERLRPHLPSNDSKILLGIDDKEFIASLTETILKALSLPQEKAEELSANAKKYAQEKYSISKMQEKYLALIEDIYKQ